MCSHSFPVSPAAEVILPAMTHPAGCTDDRLVQAGKPFYIMCFLLLLGAAKLHRVQYLLRWLRKGVMMQQHWQREEVCIAG